MNQKDFYVNSLFLEHHGIKGMKWGVRRFQNPDGTLTEAGKKRYGESARSRLDVMPSGVTNRHNVKYLDEFYKRVIAETDSPNTQKRVEKLLSEDSEQSKALKRKTEMISSATKKLNDLFIKYSRQMEKETGKEWSGDGTEEGWELEKRYPEYAAQAKRYDRLRDQFLKEVITLSGKGYFDKVVKNDFDLKHEYKDWYGRLDSKAATVGIALSKKYGLDTFPDDYGVWAAYGKKEHLGYHG